MDSDIERLSQEELIGLVKQLVQRVQVLESFVVELEAENENLRRRLERKGPPFWVKPNRPKTEDAEKSRKKRAPSTTVGAIERSLRERSGTP
jgi:hypothetical protein